MQQGKQLSLKERIALYEKVANPTQTNPIPPPKPIITIPKSNSANTQPNKTGQISPKKTLDNGGQVLAPTIIKPSQLKQNSSQDYTPVVSSCPPYVRPKVEEPTFVKPKIVQITKQSQVTQSNSSSHPSVDSQPLPSQSKMIELLNSRTVGIYHKEEHSPIRKTVSVDINQPEATVQHEANIVSVKQQSSKLDNYFIEHKNKTQNEEKTKEQSVTLVYAEPKHEQTPKQHDQKVEFRLEPTDHTSETYNPAPQSGNSLNISPSWESGESSQPTEQNDMVARLKKRSMNKPSYSFENDD